MNMWLFRRCCSPGLTLIFHQTGFSWKGISVHTFFFGKGGGGRGREQGPLWSMWKWWIPYFLDLTPGPEKTPGVGGEIVDTSPPKTATVQQSKVHTRKQCTFCTCVFRHHPHVSIFDLVWNGVRSASWCLEVQILFSIEVSTHAARTVEKVRRDLNINLLKIRCKEASLVFQTLS